MKLICRRTIYELTSGILKSQIDLSVSYFVFQRSMFSQYLTFNLRYDFSDIIDIKPPNMEDLAEVITAAEFHPTDCSTMVYFNIFLK